ncbi:TMEM175 family protein [Tenacibaculum caenipelagi]|uniref:Putative membrane protein n=1 Tax=Tenacibaculum caenipelagi TaxID=1325435 RepID=A0A4R6TEM0_9FLAO|nr:TMEM175 family protein [Tenacibaculum caenipelagi]TDQ25566.1 putative membrane protein [Tenacibaculum caenipelagi]
MKTGRLEAFSDGVLAIVITIMVLEMKAPEDTTFKGLLSVAPVFISYLLSFIYLGIYWNNHHHLLQVTKKVNGSILWANLHLLFWLSLIPFTTSWIGEHGHYNEALPVATYGFVLLMSGIAYFILERVLIKYHDDNYPLSKLCRKGTKDYISMIIYLLAVPISFVNTWISIACYIAVALMWLMPERKLEELMEELEK